MIERIQTFADDEGSRCSRWPSVGWRRCRPGSVIAGATSIEQVLGNVDAGLWVPTLEELDLLRTITAG